jgi:hypothetical protein
VLYASKENLDDLLARVHDGLNPGGCFVSHHFSIQGDPDRYAATVEFVTRLSGYATHFLDKETLEAALAKAGFTDLSHFFTGPDKRALLLVGRKA